MLGREVRLFEYFMYELVAGEIISRKSYVVELACRIEKAYDELKQ